jgi:hypothetical protein
MTHLEISLDVTLAGELGGCHILARGTAIDGHALLGS